MTNYYEVQGLIELFKKDDLSEIIRASALTMPSVTFSFDKSKGTVAVDSTQPTVRIMDLEDFKKQLANFYKKITPFVKSAVFYYYIKERDGDLFVPSEILKHEFKDKRWIEYISNISVDNDKVLLQDKEYEPDFSSNAEELEEELNEMLNDMVDSGYITRTKANSVLDDFEEWAEEAEPGQSFYFSGEAFTLEAIDEDIDKEME